MAKQLPVYDINTLKDHVTAPSDLVADAFAHYLGEHQNLRFPHKHSFYHLVYFSSGAGAHSIDFVNFPVVPGQLYFMVPGQVHTWDFNGVPDGYIVNFSEKYFYEFVSDARYLDQFSFLSGVASQQVVQIPEADREEVERLLRMIVQESRSTLPYRHDIIRTSLVQLFIRVQRSLGIAKREHVTYYQSVVFNNFKGLIEKYYKEKRLTKEYAELLYVTPNHLNALSKQLTGSSAGELIRNRVLLEIKRLLVNARMSITEIAAEMGFSDPSYFVRFFRKYEGITPDRFREQFVKNRS